MGPTLMSWLFSPIALLTLSMADDSKYGSSLSVCLSAVCRSWPRRFLSCVAARALPTPSSSSQLGPSLWSLSSCCLLGTGSWWALAHGPSWVLRGGEVLDRFTAPGCGEMQGSVMGWEGTVMGQCHVIRDSQTQADPIFVLCAEGERGHWRQEQRELCVLGSQGCCS